MLSWPLLIGGCMLWKMNVPWCLGLNQMDIGHVCTKSLKKKKHEWEVLGGKMSVLEYPQQCFHPTEHKHAVKTAVLCSCWFNIVSMIMMTGNP